MRPLRLLIEIRDVIYGHLLDSFYATHRAEILHSRFFEVFPVGQMPVLDPQITNAQYPLILTVRHGTSLALKRDLLALGQVSREQRHNHRAFLARTIQPFIRVERIKTYLDWFYPKDPFNLNRVFHGHAITVVFGHNQPTLFDFTPFMRFLAHSPQIPCDVWAHNAWPVWNPTRTHAQQVALSLFGHAGNSLRSYMTAGNEPPIERVMFRGLDQLGSLRRDVDIEIWFSHREGGPVWVDGHKWSWAAADSAPPRNDRAAKNVDKKKIMQFLTSVGLVEEEIRLHWKVEIGIQGKHRTGGCSYPV
jgi:hypothetical protein